MAKTLTVFVTVTGRGGRTFWNKVGVAYVNRDDSLNVQLTSLPLDGRLHIRENRRGGDFEEALAEVEDDESLESLTVENMSGRLEKMERELSEAREAEAEATKSLNLVAEFVANAMASTGWSQETLEVLTSLSNVISKSINLADALSMVLRDRPFAERGSEVLAAQHKIEELQKQLNGCKAYEGALIRSREEKNAELKSSRLAEELTRKALVDAQQRAEAAALLAERRGQFVREVAYLVDPECPDAEAYVDGHCSLLEAVRVRLENAQRGV